MKKLAGIICTLLLCSSVLLLGFRHSNNGKEPKTYYQVYLDDQIIGTIASKIDLEDYIDEQGSYYKEKYKVDKVYAPEGIEIKKITTYNTSTNTIEEIYDKIADLKPFTIKGYQFSIKGEEESLVVYTTKEEIFKEATENTLKSFVGSETYEAYIEDNQLKIETVGTYIDNVYIEENITIKEVLIPVEETIYIDSDNLSQYLLFGTDEENKTYTVKSGQDINEIAFENKISVEEFFISNPEFNSIDNVLYPGQQVKIGLVDPVFSVVVVKTVTEDQVSKFKVEEIPDNNMIIGDTKVIQEGENGLERITSSIKVVNGVINYVEPIETIELKPTTNKQVLVGQKYVSNVGSMYNWAWPTNSGYIITSNYGWRVDPFSGYRSFHDAIDIAGAGGYGSPIYAANNGDVITSGWHWSYGWYVVINHNNGYYTLYAHMATRPWKKEGSIAAKGEQIGVMGMTGSATGPHLHFGLYVGGPPYGGGVVTNPWIIF